MTEQEKKLRKQSIYHHNKNKKKIPRNTPT